MVGKDLAEDMAGFQNQGLDGVGLIQEQKSGGRNTVEYPGQELNEDEEFYEVEGVNDEYYNDYQDDFYKENYENDCYNLS